MTDDRLVTAGEGTGHPRWVAGAPIPAPLRLHRATVQPSWVDYNRHMSESSYLLAFGDNADAFFRYIGIDEQYRADGHSLYTVETHLHHRREVGEGESLSMTLRVLDLDDKRVHVFHEMFLGDGGPLLATAEQMLVHVEMRAGRSAPMPRALARRLEAIHRAHAQLALPETVGRPMRINRA
ncbi:MAG: thioesterase family protein [Nocardioidaceae bacterium]